MSNLKAGIEKMNATKSIAPGDWRSLIIGIAQEIIQQKFNDISDEIQKQVKEIVLQTAKEQESEVFSRIKGDQGAKGEAGVIGDIGERGPKGDRGIAGKDGKKGKDGKNGNDGTNGLNGKNGNDGKNGSPDKPKEIVAKLSSLTGADRLDKSAIKGIDEELRSIASLARESKKQGGGGDSLLVYNLSAYLDGSTKSFTIPPHRKILGFFQSSEPFGAFVENTDFTHTRTRITFTSQVNAPTALASGQALIILYSR